MLSKNQIKLLRSLGQKKFRRSLNQFLVQGEKNVVELLKSDLNVCHIFATQAFADGYQHQVCKANLVITDEQTLSKVSTLTTNNSVIAVVEIPAPSAYLDTGLTLALDGVSDPGNLGTIIRVADWYGIKQVILGEHCADPYNPKSISATMGSFCRVEFVFAELTSLLRESIRPKYGAYLQGENIHKLAPPRDAIIVMGSESHGISHAVTQCIDAPITIPNFGHAESLNVAMATGIILDNFVRCR